MIVTAHMSPAPAASTRGAAFNLLLFTQMVIDT